ncbi:MAG: GWxTD domain-containing protein [Acidobacteriota bacterium]|nr:GWxTD domain-containing protein [Acidobacteriota bacterium]
MSSVRALALLAVAALAAGCGTAAPAPPSRLPEAAAWAAGPVRWLLLPEEIRELGQLRNVEAVAGFRDRFWARRDPDPDTPGNAALESFLERVAIADRLYGSPDRDGSLTPRGRALILLGPPSRLRVAPPPLPLRPRPGRPAAGAGHREAWGWVASDLAPALRGVLPPPGADGEWRLVFELAAGRERLIEGEALLAVAARGWLRQP